jgi:trypsin
MRCSLFLPSYSFGSLVLVVIAFFLRTQTSQVISSNKIIRHPNYNGWSVDNDYALVRLSSPATGVTPVTMDMDGLSGTYTSSSNKLWAIGFGNTVTSGQNLPSRLKHVEISYVPTNTCNSTNMYGGEITQNMMCAADPNEDSCQGDSGA